MILPITPSLYLELINPGHAQAIFELVDKNRAQLRVWLPFVDRMQTVDFAKNFINGTMQRNAEESEHAFVIILDNKVIGRVGLYKIDLQNKIGEIGYWIAEDQQGKGIVTQSCKRIIDFAFTELQLNRIEIKCGTGNTKSQAIPERLHFTKEGILRQAEQLYDQFIDLNLYSLLKQDFN